MLPFTDPPTGKAITRDQAHRMFKRFISIKQRSIVKVADAVDPDYEASRFHCGRPMGATFDPYLDISFFFNAKLLRTMLGQLSTTDPPLRDQDGLVIFFGAREQEDSLGEDDKPPFTDVDGRPTLMLFRYRNNPKDPNKMKFTDDGTFD